MKAVIVKSLIATPDGPTSERVVNVILSGGSNVGLPEKITLAQPWNQWFAQRYFVRWPNFGSPWIHDVGLTLEQRQKVDIGGPTLPPMDKMKLGQPLIPPLGQ